jgi:hypothetical protein
MTRATVQACDAGFQEEKRKSKSKNTIKKRMKSKRTSRSRKNHQWGSIPISSLAIA